MAETRAESKDSAVAHDQPRDSSNPVNEYRRVFQHYFATLCNVIPTDQMLPRLVSSEVITMDEMDEIEAKETLLAKTRALLRGPIWRAVNGGYPNTFLRLLCVIIDYIAPSYIIYGVMRSLRIRSCDELSEEICDKLDISSEVISELTGE